MSRDVRDFEQRAREALDSSVSGLDAATRGRLAATRREALEQRPLLARFWPTGNWIPAIGVAASAVLAVALFMVNPQTETPLQVAKVDADIAMDILLGSGESSNGDLTGSEGIENDPDFYMVMGLLILSEEDEPNAG